NIGNRNHWLGLRLVGQGPAAPKSTSGTGPASSTTMSGAGPGSKPIGGNGLASPKPLGGNGLASSKPIGGNGLASPKPIGEGGRDAVGARVAVIRSSGPTLWRRARADGSYASANDPRVLVGLGQSEEKPRVRVIWPGGHSEEWIDVLIDRYTTLTEGTGK